MYLAHTMHVLDGSVCEIVWMKVFVPRFSGHLSLGVAKVKLTAVCTQPEQYNVAYCAYVSSCLHIRKSQFTLCSRLYNRTKRFEYSYNK